MVGLHAKSCLVLAGGEVLMAVVSGEGPETTVQAKWNLSRLCGVLEIIFSFNFSDKEQSRHLLMGEEDGWAKW